MKNFRQRTPTATRCRHRRALLTAELRSLPREGLSLVDEGRRRLPDGRFNWKIVIGSVRSYRVRQWSSTSPRIPRYSPRGLSRLRSLTYLLALSFLHLFSWQPRAYTSYLAVCSITSSPRADVAPLLLRQHTSAHRYLNYSRALFDSGQLIGLIGFYLL